MFVKITNNNNANNNNNNNHLNIHIKHIYVHFLLDFVCEKYHETT